MRCDRTLLIVALLLLAAGLVGCRPSGLDAANLEVPENAVARIVFFRADDCEHCERVYDDVIAPLMRRCGENLEVKSVDIADADGYEAFLATEAYLIGEPGRWEIPAVVVGDAYFTGDAAIRSELLPYLNCVFGAGGNDWPAVRELTGIVELAPTPALATGANPFGGNVGVESCVDEDDSAICASPTPIFALYFTPAKCNDSCDRTRYDLRYLEGVYPQLSYEERVIDDALPLARALGETLGIPQEYWGVAPAVIIGKDYLVGDALNLTALREAVSRYTESGAKAIWYTIDVP